MKTSTNAILITSAVGAIVFSLTPLACVAADGGWKMPSLNPFGAKSKAANAGDAPVSGWHPTRLWPKPGATKRGGSPASAWNKMTTGTQKFFAKTTDALTPWDNKPAAPPPKITGSNSIFTHQSDIKKKEASGNSIAPASWWSSDKKGHQPKSVNEFLSQPRPQ